MFKKNFLQLPNNTNYFELYILGAGGNQNYFITYGNVKSAARIQDHLCPNAAHRCYNYANKEPKYAFFFLFHTNLFIIFFILQTS